MTKIKRFFITSCQTELTGNGGRTPAPSSIVARANPAAGPPPAVQQGWGPGTLVLRAGVSDLRSSDGGAGGDLVSGLISPENMFLVFGDPWHNLKKKKCYSHRGGRDTGGFILFRGLGVLRKQGKGAGTAKCAPSLLPFPSKVPVDRKVWFFA